MVGGRSPLPAFGGTPPNAHSARWGERQDRFFVSEKRCDRLRHRQPA
jgi:hypothetical protein